MDILVEITIRAYAGAMMEPAVKEINYCVPTINEHGAQSLTVPDVGAIIQGAIVTVAQEAWTIELDRIDREPEPFADEQPEPGSSYFDHAPA